MRVRSCTPGEEGGVNRVIYSRERGMVWGGEVVHGIEQLTKYVRSVIFCGKFRFGSVWYGRGREH